MHKVTSQVGTGAITPPIVGPVGGIKLHYVFVGFLLLLALSGWAFWDTLHRDGKPESTQSATIPLTSSSSEYSIETKPLAALPAPTVVPIVESTNVRHEDIYFEVGRRGLTDEAKAILQKQTAFMTTNPDWGVLIQGHTDRQGSDGYNQILGLKRAETVKQYLVNLGVAEHAIKVVSLGKAGALCADNSDQCRNMNRRVHLEFRKVGLTHMTPPAPIVAQPVAERVDEGAIVEPAAIGESTEESEPSTEMSAEPETTESSTGDIHP